MKLLNPIIEFNFFIKQINLLKFHANKKLINASSLVYFILTNSKLFKYKNISKCP